MRRILISIVFAFLITVGVLDIVFTNGTFNKAEVAAIELRDSIEQGDESLINQKVNYLQNTWENRIGWMQIFIMYAEIKPISEKIAKIVSLIEEKDEEALVEVEALIIEIKDVHEIYKLNLPNLF